MTAPVHPQELLEALGAVVQPDVQLRQQAEAFVQTAYGRQGCALALVQVASEARVETGIRQLAAILLKQCIKKRWSVLDSSFEGEELSNEEKQAVRDGIVNALWAAPPSVRTPLGVAIAAIANWDFPEEWPGVLDTMLQAALSDATDDQSQSLREAALRTVSLMSEDMDDEHLPAMLQALLPMLLRGLQRPETSGMHGVTLRLALSVATSCIASMAMMEPAARKRLRAVLAEHMQPLMQALCKLLGAPLSADDSRDWAVKLEALKICQHLLMSARAATEAHIPSVLQHVWRLFLAAPAVFEATVLDDAPGDDDDADGCTFESVIEQIFEFMLTVASIGKHDAHMRAVLEQLVYHAIGYMQMTAEQRQAWSDDPNQYVADEEDEVFGVRSSCEMLLQELQSKLGREMTDAVNRVGTQRLGETLALKASGVGTWWRLREAALYAIGTQVSLLDDDDDDGGGGGGGGGDAAAGLDVPHFLQQVLEHDLRPSDVPPFLRGRALWVAAKLASQLPPEQAAQLLPAAVAGLSSANAIPVRIGACRALAALCKRVDNAALEASIQRLYQGLVGLMQEVDQDVLILVLDTLQAVVKAHPGAAAQYAASVTAFLVRVFPQFANDVHLNETIQSLVSRLAAAPGSLAAMAKEGVPPLLQILADASQHPAVLVEGTLDLLCCFVSESNRDVTEQLYVAAVQRAIGLLSCGEPSIVQSVCELLRCFLTAGGAAMLTWGGNSEQQSLQMLQGVLAYVLRPDMEDSAAMFVSGLILQAMRALPDFMPSMLPHLLQLLVVKVLACGMPAVRGQLLVVITRLIVELDVDQQLAVLSQCSLPNGQDAVREFFACWMEHALDTAGEFQLRLCALAIARLVASKHAALQAVQVKGKGVPQAGVGVRTRSQAARKGSGLTHASVPLPTKMMHVLVQLLKEADDTAQDRSKDWRELLYGAGADDEYYDTDDDEEDGSNAEDDAAERAPAGAALGSVGADLGPAVLAAMAEDDEDEVDECWVADPLYQQDILQATKDTLRQLVQTDRAYFSAALAELSQDQIAYLTSLFEQRPR